MGASLSTSITGFIAQRFGYTVTLLSVTAVGLAAVAIVFLFMPETKPVNSFAEDRPTQFRPGAASNRGQGGTLTRS
jgi:predicted MFS family arabinose efflux permease